MTKTKQEKTYVVIGMDDCASSRKMTEKEVVEYYNSLIKGMNEECMNDNEKMEIAKNFEEAKKNLITVPIVGTSIPHEFVGQFGSAKVMLKPAVEGTGIIAGGSVRPVLELAGYRDIRTKIIGTNNPRNVVYATIEGLKAMQTAEQVAKKRGKKVEDIL